ncbi:hypothetical protein ACFOUP_16765 [Belliella kenyensis]|uniref:Uncharacterized protein n=1 Tax=Belliella kenyensis TaxID=1472724 RepID=A0ABV8ESC0_9BACT|nr:hypothetical protein [Belliella kenyensis]MCH7402899.1 hypothetical protein [Belliella kenyensis]MDN3602605.1 hypothetical protein [Belliella kenyensis]
MNRVKLKYLESGMRFFLTSHNKDLRLGEKFVLLTIIRLLEENQIVSKSDVCKENKVSNSTTYAIIRALECKGFVKSIRQNQYYSKAFISISPKGLLFKNSLRKVFSD